MRRLIALILPLLIASTAHAAHADEVQKEDALHDLLRSFAAESGDVDNLLALRAAVNDAILESALAGLGAASLPVLGQPGGKTIYEFSDYQCGFCRRMFPAVAAAADSGDVQVALIELPILGPMSDKAARVALAAQAQGKFSAYHRALMGAGGRLSEDKIDAAISAAELDTLQMADYLASGEADAQLEANFRLAALLRVNGTPAFIINRNVYRGALRDDDFQRLLNP